MQKRQVTIQLDEDDCKWLEGLYGDTWITRMEQHIHSEVHLRRQDADPLREKPPWDY